MSAAYPQVCTVVVIACKCMGDFTSTSACSTCCVQKTSPASATSSAVGSSLRSERPHVVAVSSHAMGCIISGRVDQQLCCTAVTLPTAAAYRCCPLLALADCCYKSHTAACCTLLLHTACCCIQCLSMQAAVAYFVASSSLARSHCRCFTSSQMCCAITPTILLLINLNLELHSS